MKKICSWLLVLAMLVTWLPAGALAAGIETGETGRIRRKCKEKGACPNWVCGTVRLRHWSSRSLRRTRLWISLSCWMTAA